MSSMYAEHICIIVYAVQRPNSWKQLGQKSYEFSPFFSQSPLQTDFSPTPPPLSKNGLKLACNVNTVHGNKSENSQDYAQKPQRHCDFMNSASGRSRKCLIRDTLQTKSICRYGMRTIGTGGQKHGGFCLDEGCVGCASSVRHPSCDTSPMTTRRGNISEEIHAFLLSSSLAPAPESRQLAQEGYTEKKY
jgi:hypothetical protein